MPLHVDTVNWLASISDELHDRLARVRLTSARKQSSDGPLMLAKMVDDYIERRRADMKPWSITTLKQSRDKLVEFFGKDKAVHTITIAATPDVEWKLIIALARYGGVRVPSEVLALRWGDVLWDQSKILIRASKTEHHVGKESRLIPLFPELKSHLLGAFAQAEEGATHVITRYRNPAVNIRTQFLRILAKAGIEPWPKLFQNLRSSRQTELTESWPAHVVCAWIGNSEVVARDHYLQITDEHFAKAAEAASETGGAESGAASARKTSQDVAPCSGSDSANAASAGACDSVRDDAMQCEEVEMGDTGLEPVTPSVSCWCSGQLS
jgi:hypothetical protein